MSYPAVIDAPGTNIAGTSPVDTGSFQHAQQHDTLGSCVIGIETTLGTNSGTAVLGAFTTNDKAVRHQGGTLQIAHQGTFNNSVIGTPAITGGTANSQVIGTPAITGGTANNQVLGTPALTGGTATSQTISTPTIRNWDGWEDANEAWTFASATTITVPTGAASKYSIGDKIKLTQTTVKYFYIVGVADTLLTVTGGSDYTIANAAISANFYSHGQSPLGFPQSFNYAMAWGGGSPAIGNGTITAKFSLYGNKCFVDFVLLFGSTTTFGSGTYTFSFPLAIKTNVPALGNMWAVRQGVSNNNFYVDFVSSATAQFKNAAGDASLTNTNPATWQSGDIFGGNFVYAFA